MNPNILLFSQSHPNSPQTQPANLSLSPFPFPFPFPFSQDKRMERASTISLVIIVSVLCVAVSVSATSRTGSSDFIKSSCSSTRYPAVCVQSLSVYASAIQQSPKQLAQAALNVSLARARSVSTFVSKLSHDKGMSSRDRAAIKDCVDNIGDSVDELTRSVQELGRTGKSGSFMWHVSNVQTWVSAALTDENTCVDGFVTKGKVKDVVRGRIVNVAQVTSNALALVNRYAHKSGTNNAANP